MFQLTKPEAEALKSQIVISNIGRGGRRYEPYVFTEQGVAMLAGVLRSDRAITVNIEIMRAFVELRRAAGSFQELQKRLDQMELDIGGASERARRAASPDLRSAAAVDRAAAQHEVADRHRAEEPLRRPQVELAIEGGIAIDDFVGEHLEAPEGAFGVEDFSANLPDPAVVFHLAAEAPALQATPGPRLPLDAVSTNSRSVPT